MRKKTVTKTKITTRTVVLIIIGVAAAGGLAYAAYMMNGNSRSTQECVNSCLEYQDTDPEYVDICQKSCKNGEVIIYDAIPIENLDSANSDSSVGNTVEPIIDSENDSEVVQ